jgi:hypothetical protein
LFIGGGLYGATAGACTASEGVRGGPPTEETGGMKVALPRGM